MFFISLFFIKKLYFFQEVGEIGSISRKKEMEIRLRYEYGEDLKVLAAEYKIPLATLNFKKKKSRQKGDPWIKGFRNKQGYENFVEDEAERKKFLLDKINREITGHLEHAEKLINFLEIQEDKDIAVNDDFIISKKVEEAIGKRIENVSKIAELKRDIAGVYTPEKQIIIDKLNIELELRKVELEEKKTDLSIKKETEKLYR